MNIRPEDFEMSPMAAYGLIAIALIIGVLGLEKYAVLETRLEQTVVTAQTELATLSTIRDTDYWAERLLQSSSTREVLQTEIWQGNTSGVVAAELQQSLRSLGMSHKFTEIKVRVDPDPVDIDGISVLKFEFSGQATSAKSLADFFEGFATHSKIIILEEANFTQSIRDRRPPRLSMAGLIPVQIAPPGGT